ncbi:MAG: hypothetical protein M0Z35_08950 [Desulfitobacterium hafniense]|nr:hypothetical protein [Desulfitobacterium hafniense]
MDVLDTIDRAIKLVWKEDILRDYNNDFILKEDTLKNAFYYHLRARLGDDFLREHNFRIFSEYYLKNNERADLAIAMLKPEEETAGQEYHLNKVPDVQSS